jgi:hypothetical protein
MLAPTGTDREENQGPVALRPTCFRTAIDGLTVFTVNVFEAVLPVPPFVEETVPLVFA